MARKTQNWVFVDATERDTYNSGGGGVLDKDTCILLSDASEYYFDIGTTAWVALATGGAAIPTGNTLWVDGVNGNDGTAISGSMATPGQYLTIGAALAAAASGDTVIARPGVYPESGLTVAAGVVLNSEGGPLVTSITGAAATGTRITVAAGGELQGFGVTIPSDAVPAIACTHAAGVATVGYVTFSGTGASGIGLRLSAAGKLICSEIRYGTGDCDAIVEANAAGILALDSMHVPATAGAVAVGVRLSGGSRGQIIHPNMGAPSVVTGIQVLDATLVGIGVNIFNCTNALRISDNTADIRITTGVFEASTFNILVDPGLTGVGGSTRVQVQMDPLFSIPSSWIDSDHAWSFFTKNDDAEDASLQLWGAPQVIGHPEKGSGLSVGEGIPYSSVNTVLTTDSSSGPASNGAGFVDVSAAAESKTGSPFTFQGPSAGHSIMWCTNRVDASGSTLKHWGVELDQIAAAVLGGGSFIWEIQSAASTWVEVDVMAVSIAEQYRYANQIFLRAASAETIRPGVDSETTWPQTTIDGTLGQWMRVRIAATITTEPTFQRLRLIPSVTAVNAMGQYSAKGLAQWTDELFGVGNIWGEVTGGGSSDGNIPVGSGGGATGWTQKIKKGSLNSSGDSVSFQFQIPVGICTAFPLAFTLCYSLDGGSPITVAPDVILSVLILARGSVLIADSAGGITPVSRPSVDAEVLTSKPATPITVATDIGAITDRGLGIDFGPFPMANYYAGDTVVIRLELDSDGTPNQDLIIWTLLVNGIKFSTGNPL